MVLVDGMSDIQLATAIARRGIERSLKTFVREDDPRVEPNHSVYALVEGRFHNPLANAQSLRHFCEGVRYIGEVNPSRAWDHLHAALRENVSWNVFTACVFH